MRRIVKPFLITCGIVCSLCLVFASRPRAADAPTSRSGSEPAANVQTASKLDSVHAATDFRYVGSASCAAAACHGGDGSGQSWQSFLQHMGSEGRPRRRLHGPVQRRITVDGEEPRAESSCPSGQGLPGLPRNRGRSVVARRASRLRPAGRRELRIVSRTGREMVRTARPGRLGRPDNGPEAGAGLRQHREPFSAGRNVRFLPRRRTWTRRQSRPNRRRTSPVEF